MSWHHKDCEGSCIACLIEQAVQESYGNQGLSYLQRHLATHHQAREPLTEVALLGAYESEQQGRWGDHVRGLRAIEAAHGIKGAA